MASYYVDITGLGPDPTTLVCVDGQGFTIGVGSIKNTFPPVDTMPAVSSAQFTKDNGKTVSAQIVVTPIDGNAGLLDFSDPKNSGLS